MEDIDAKLILLHQKVDCSMDVRNPIEILRQLIASGHLSPDLLVSQVVLEPITTTK